jgi:hypothetical protein
MKKLHRSQQKKLSGGGPCGKKLCTNDFIPAGAIFTGTCAPGHNCNTAYVVYTSSNCSVTTFCSTDL